MEEKALRNRGRTWTQGGTPVGPAFRLLRTARRGRRAACGTFAVPPASNGFPTAAMQIVSQVIGSE